MKQFNDRLFYNYLKSTGNKIKCPYCNQMVDVNDFEIKEEFVGSKVSFPWYLPNSIKISYYKDDMPICRSCSYVFLEAKEKSMHFSLIVIAVLFAIESTLCYLGNNEDAWWGLVVFDIPLFFIIRFILCYIFVKMKGIKYHVKSFTL